MMSVFVLIIQYYIFLEPRNGISLYDRYVMG